jgi:hypothetical protein
MGLCQFSSIPALALIPSVLAAVSTTGYTVSLADVAYFIPPKAVGKISFTGSLSEKFNNGAFVPLTVFTPATANFAAADASALTAQYLAEDDVFQEGFLDGMIVSLKQTTQVLTIVVIFAEGIASSASTEMTVGNVSCTVATGAVTSGSLNSGPYFMNAAGEVFEAWRLYSDTNGAFTESAISDGEGSYSVLPAGILGQKLAIAVPSRLYFTKTEEKPLAGVRIGIKDIYDVKGLRRSNGNRACTYPRAEVLPRWYSARHCQ